MIIGVDVRGLQQGTLTGVEQYILNLLENIAKIDRENQYLLFFNSLKNVTDRIPDFGPNFFKKGFHIPNKILDPMWRLTSFPKITRLLGKLDLFFSPGIRIAPLPASVPAVVTSHDLSFVRYPEFFSFKQRLWHWQMAPKSQVKNARAIIAVSESTKADLIKYYQVDPKKIQVVYEGIAPKFIPLPKDNAGLKKIKEKYHLPERFILSLGTIEPRKNLVGLVKAFKKIKSELNMPLVIAGSRGWLYKNLFDLIKKENLENDIIFTGFVAEEDKVFLYNLALIFVYPSFYEGFGFPPLEAMAAGVPVIASNISSLPEVVGRAGLLVDPANIDELAWAILNLANSQELRSSLIQKGLLQAKKFNWEDAAKLTLKLFNEVGRG